MRPAEAATVRELSAVAELLLSSPGRDATDRILAHTENAVTSCVRFGVESPR